jgi:CubicO group peptidase (beta-lactamase class C family)
MNRKTAKRDSKNNILITALLITIILTLSFRLITGDDSTLTDVEEEMPVAINHLLTNELSNLEETVKMDAQIERFMKQWGIKGASLAIMKDERLIYAKGYGVADHEKEELTQVRHIFRIASVSKLLTAASIMKLTEQGHIKLSDKIFSEGGVLDLPQFYNIRDRRAKSITIEHLLRHQGGFSSRGGDPMFNLPAISRKVSPGRAPESDEIISFVLGQRLGFNPGSGTRYSNIGYLILSRVIEIVSGESYEDFVKEKILFPAGVYDMHIAGNYYSDKYQNEVRYYSPENEELTEAYNGTGIMVERHYGGNNIKALMGAGAWVASPSELLKLVAALDGRDGVKDILTQESISIMTSSTPSDLPIGWARSTTSGEWTRTGSFSGTSALLKYNRDGYSWVFITNTSSWKGAGFPVQINALFRSALQKVSDWPERDLFDVRTQY